MQQTVTRAELESRLKSVAMRLVVRQVVRASVSGVTGAAFGLAVGIVFLDLLPRALFAFSAGGGALAASGMLGFLVGSLLDWRRYKLPTLQDAALALEARLENDTGALAAALRVEEGSSFYRPVITRAAGELRRAQEASAPELLSTRRLVLVPMFALAVGVGVVAVLGMTPPDRVTSIPAPPTEVSDARESWNAIDTGRDRTDSDSAAYREAMRMEETATTLKKSAKTLRDAAASSDSKQQALDEARKAVESVGNETVGLAPGDLPDELPADTKDQAVLADKLEGAAAGLSADAARLKADSAATTQDSGTSGDFDVSVSPREFVTLPALKLEPGKSTAQSLATQTPARRALAARAVQSLERIQEG